MNLLHPTKLPACFVFTVATQILNLKWISKFWHFSFHGVCYWMILCWFESAWIRLFYFTSKSVNFFYCRFLITLKRFLVLIDYSKGTDWKQLLLLEMSECFSRWAALVGVANFEWPLLTRGVLKKVLYREASSRGPTTYPFIFQFRLKRYPFRRPSIDKWYPFHIPFFRTSHPLNCCKRTVFEIWINHKTTTFSRRFSLQP